ncbi:uncharacterized protein LOC126677281 [Mercurialis annua]|uniref:uncharacterized protein LOC126677281 n=1 Tax=Mercurialis annua TaxID=3986 RepID=UPI00215E17C0|nr:uncharacterized protein LOC126677281 [Mercurialis annua]
MPTNFAKIKKLVKGLVLPVEEKSAKRKANVPYSKMFYFRITPRLQRLYASKATARHMTWHADHEMDGDKMCHPSDSSAWKRFSELHSEFADEVRNIRLGLCSDGFQPFANFGQQYSSWPVILTPYNLPPELNQLWECGVQTYDVHKRQNFELKAALMWTINDFPAYSMLSGWSTAGRKACPYCMENTDSFTLEKSEIDILGFKKAFEPGAKVTNALLSKDHWWNKKSIFWDLPYWRTNVIRHNLDVMHIEKNVFGNIFNTVLNVPGKTKDHAKSREELNNIYDRPGLANDPATGRFPKAMYALDRDSKRVLLEWIQKIKFPDGYASNLSKCVDLNGLKMHGMKSHDCHVFMQRLLPIALRELLSKNVWEPLTELSIFFKELTSRSLSEEDLNRMKTEIPKILCKLERIFPPSFFDSMEHIPVHLPYEDMMAGPVQYRWMYPFER